METLKSIDLRINNFVLHKNEVLAVKSISNSVVSLDGKNYWVLIKDCKPIQLTEAWLIRAGFEKFRHIKDGIVFDNSWLRINESMVAYWRGGYIGKIKYVHSLQNIYFALVGTELEFKPE